ncbi:solute carrier family 25 member 45 [Myxozyma melibiosi]|uniref:Solute carrier family 25 member 45 n=1 Tax=Myxozyma melibiosi TaxID=54550 RepID=A0ABR1F633_9ASCO
MPTPTTDFIAGYVSGAVSIAVGNPLDIIKVKLQNASSSSAAVTLGEADELRAVVQRTTATATATAAAETATAPAKDLRYLRSLLHGVAAPIIGYGALNALLFASYSITMRALTSPSSPAREFPEIVNVFGAGTVAGLSTFVISAPIENVKCRAQATHSGALGGSAAGAGAGEVGKSSWKVAKEVYKFEGFRGFFKGGLVTGFRDGFGYGVYFWAYNAAKGAKLVEEESGWQHVVHLLLAGGIAGCATWASIFPLDVIKTRYQTQPVSPTGQPLKYSSTWDCAKKSFAEGGVRVFFSGLKVCLVRAFLVNAIQFGTYEWMVKVIDGR